MRASLTGGTPRADDLPDLMISGMKISRHLAGDINLLTLLRKKKGVIIPEKEALWLPRGISHHEESTICMFLDEFQNTRLPQYSFSIVSYMQETVELPTCPHFVTCSAEHPGKRNTWSWIPLWKI
nr:hypothetical protein GZ18F2_17 [uncultured archaeon GZfos18F2]